MMDEILTDPPYRIGIIGGGQLGKMMTIAAKQLGFAVTVLDPVAHCPASQVADQHKIAPYHHRQAVEELLNQCQVVTYEFEHIDSQLLIQLSNDGSNIIHPDPSVLAVIQDKGQQKKVLQQAGIPVPRFLLVTNKEDVQAAGRQFNYPLVLKTCGGGYDGKGNYLIDHEGAIDEALRTLNKGALMVEEFVPFQMEISVMVARSVSGEIAVYPLSENYHEDNILRKNIVPAAVDSHVETKALAMAKNVLEVFKGVGIFCVEMFATAAGDVLVNEVAPRPHNSGHYTIEGCHTSQFEQHIRAIVDLPLGSTRLREPAVTVNLLGEEGHRGAALLKGCEKALALPGVNLHWYGKKNTEPKRKMGHITVVADNREKAIHVADEAMKTLRVIAANK